MKPQKEALPKLPNNALKKEISLDSFPATEAVQIQNIRLSVAKTIQETVRSDNNIFQLLYSTLNRLQASDSIWGKFQSYIKNHLEKIPRHLSKTPPSLSHQDYSVLHQYFQNLTDHNLLDLYNKAEKAFAIKGPKILVVYSPCISNWQFKDGLAIDVAKLATETNFWPLYEVEDGKYKINFKPANRKPIEEFLKGQNRFKHLFKDEKGLNIIKEIQENVDKEWEKLLDLEHYTNK